MKLKYLFAYLNERFPIINMVAFATIYFTVLSFSLYTLEKPFSFAFEEALGILAVVSFFFLLRVFDEIKDFDIDMELHPNRVLQSGRIRLKDLKIVVSFLLISSVVWSWLMGMPTLISFAIVFGYCLLMRYEFFVPEFLKKHLFLYAFSHMLIMPLVMLWIWSAQEGEIRLSQPLLFLMLHSLLIGFSLEVARKIHAPNDERKGLDSYSKSLSFGGAITTIILLLTFAAFIQVVLLNQIEAGIISYFLVATLYFVLLFLYITSYRKPSQKKFRSLEKGVSLFMLISYLTIIIEIALK